MRHLPLLLIYSRLVMGAVAVFFALFPFSGSNYLIIGLVAAGLVSDILDGIIARRLGISTEKLRRLDSSIDQIFWVAIACAATILTPEFFKEHWASIALLLALEACCYLVSFVRFGKEVATHAIASKIWTLSLFATLVQLIGSGNSGWLFPVCIYFGMLTRLEILLILLLIRRWTNDVPSIYHAILLRNNKPIKRNKYFNG